MRVLAVLHPAISPDKVEPFRQPGIDLAVANDLRAPADADAILILGGDGTVHRHLPHLVRMRAPVLVIPVGSGNDFARAIGLKSPSDSLTTWRKFCAGRGNIRNIDLGSIRASPDPDSETLFCCVAGAGLDAEANRRANAMPRWLRARGGYILALLAALSRFHPCQMTLHSAESPARLSECALVVAVANAPGYGNGMRIAPGASMEDGRLDACFVRPAGMLRLLRLFPRVYSGTHVGLPEVESLQSRCLRLESDVPMDIYADGEFAGRTPAEFRVVPGALPVIVA